MKNRKRFHFTPLLIFVIFSVLTLGLLLGGHFYFQKEKASLKFTQGSILSAISSVKAEQITRWTEERSAEGVFLTNSPNFISLVRNINDGQFNNSVSKEMELLLMPIKKNHDYKSIWVCSAKGQVVFSLCDIDKPFQSLNPESLKRYLLTDTISFSDITTDKETNRSFFDMIVPVAEGNRKLGIVVFRLDPRQFLYPMIASWPIENSSSENILARQQGDSLVYIYGHRTSETLPKINTSPDLTDDLYKNNPATGTLSMIEAKDYLGVDVLADIRKIKGTPWSLVTKIDLKEINASLKSRAVNIAFYLLIFIGLMLISLILFWKNQQLYHYRHLLEMQVIANKAEERIRFMNALLEGVNDAIITFDKDMIIQSWNKGAEQIYGWKASEVIGKYGGGSLRVDFPGTARESIMKELETTGAWKGEVMHKRKDGSTAYLLSSTSNLRDENGKVLGIITINKDISEVVKLEKSKNAVYRISELAHASRDLNELFTSIHVVIGELMDARNFYIALRENENQSLTFPYFVDENQSHPPPNPMSIGLTEFVLKTGKPLLVKPEDKKYFCEHGIVTGTDSETVDWLGIPLRIEKETIGVLVIKSYSSKTRYGDREKDILHFVSEQIALSIQRKKILQELVEAKQKAEVSNKLVSSLLANMNHELRTPLNGILGFAEILMYDLKDQEAKGKAENILVSGRRLMDTLDAIMDLSYLESDKISRKFKLIKVGPVIISVIRSFEEVIKQKKLSLTTNISDDLAVMGDEHLFRHLLKNLIDNAVKYTERGTIAIEAALVDHEEAERVSITVKDTGIGISREHYRLIFDAFRQVSEGYGRQFEGSGLGLAICKRIVDLMKGEITLKSVLNQGSEFQVLFASARLPKLQESLTRKDILTPKLHPDDSKKLPDVLIVEDNLVNIQLLMIYIRQFCNIYTALDAKAAIELSRQRKFDAVLMDINLGPGMDGIQAMLEMRKIPDYFDTPILAVTGYASIGDRERFLTIGFTGYIPKPYDKVTISAMMTELFSGETGSNRKVQLPQSG